MVLGWFAIGFALTEDASLPFNCPGLQSSNGNFVLTEFEVYVEAR